MAKEVLVHDYQKMQQMKGLFGVCVCVSAEKRGLRGETEAREEGGGGKRSAEKDERAEDKRTEGMGAD